jgi:hypothetical protein
MAMSFVASTRGVALLPAYARNLLPSSLIDDLIARVSKKIQ